MENTASNRRKYFKVLDPVVQKDIYRYLAALWVGWVLVQAFFIFYIEWLAENVDFIDRKFLMMMLFFIFSSTLFLFTLLSVNFFIGRFIGPIYRMRKEIKEARDTGKEINIKLRDGDYFQDIAEQINTMKFKE